MEEPGPRLRLFVALDLPPAAISALTAFRVAAADPVEAVKVLTDLPGSEQSPVGSGHSYGGVLPPAGCVS